MTITVLSVASEAVPLVKTGGLADVVGALPAAVAPHGVEMTTLLPGYPAVLRAIEGGSVVHRYPALFDQPASLIEARLGAHRLIVVDAPTLFNREGNPYSDSSGTDWPDNWRRFAALGRAAADVAGGLGGQPRFDLVHAHDWQAGLAPAYLRFAPAGDGPRVASVMTIHNMAFQGVFAPGIFAALGLPKAAFAYDGVEYHGAVGMLKAGMQTADRITTVSPTYAAEIRDSEFGMGLEGLVTARADRVSGIVNGIDPALWNPASDPLLARNYTVRTLSKRVANKRALEKSFGLDRDDGPLMIVISRLTWQKGMDVLLEVIDHLVGLGGRLALLGSGDGAIEAALHGAATRHPGRVGIRIGYDEALSHRMQAGGDAILVPSRFEPCGLTQLYGLAYGCVPVVARTGGLADTVVDANLAAINCGVATGVQFVGIHYKGLSQAISRTMALYARPVEWRRLQQNGMRADFSWGRSGLAYAELYRSILAETE